MESRSGAMTILYNEQNKSLNYLIMKSIMYTVYAHVNPITGRAYVGVTTFPNLNRRFQNGKHYENNVEFTKDINEIGWNNFDHVILGQTKVRSIAADMEKEYITYYKEIGLSYNIKIGGKL